MSPTRKTVLGYTIAAFKMVIGCTLYAVGFQYFTYPNHIVSGGVLGVSMIINNFTGFPVGVMTIIINIPLFALAWRYMGLRFLLTSLFGMLLSSILMDVFALFPAVFTTEPLLASVFGGLIKGAGLGLIYSIGTTTGGIDIVAKYLKKKMPHINFGTLVLALDAVVIVFYAIVFGKYENSMYAVISIFVFSKVVDLMLYGAINAKACFIISNASVELKNAISDKLGRGATLLYGKGAYSGLDKQVILCVLKSQQIVALRRIVRDIDASAFMIVSDAREVFGSGFGDITSEET